MSIGKLMEHYTYKEWDSDDESDDGNEIDDGGWETCSESDEDLDKVENIAPQPDAMNIFIGPNSAIPAGFA